MALLECIIVPVRILYTGHDCVCVCVCMWVRACGTWCVGGGGGEEEKRTCTLNL